MEKIETCRGLNDFSFLDQTDFKKKYATGPLENTIRFYIGGIRCGKCVRKLEDLALTSVGIMNVRVELGNKIASVEIDPATLSFSELAESIKKLGFVPTPLMTQNDEAELQKNEDRSVKTSTVFQSKYFP